MRERAFDLRDGNIQKLHPVIPTLHTTTRSYQIGRCQCTGCHLAKLSRQPTNDQLISNTKEMVLR